MPAQKTTKAKAAKNSAAKKSSGKASKKMTGKEKNLKGEAVVAEKKVVVIRPKKEVISEFKTHEKDTGSTQLQVAIMTVRILQLTEHLKLHPKDNHSRRGLLGLVGKRRKLLTYLRKKSKDAYETVTDQLGLRS